ncbi:MAG: hypothetical protein SPG32_08095 [Candidatus Ventricola sp.]|nr:hypothetical protein [Candidatus Ventricola sp.]
MLCLAPDAGGASGEAAVASPEQQTSQAEAVQDTQTAETQAAAQAAPSAEGQSAEEQQAESDTERAQEDALEKEQTAPLKERLANMQAKLGEYQLRTAAALAGVPKGRIPYVMRMADVTGLDPTAADAAEHYQQAVDKVLADVPELRGGAGTGSTGNFARKPVDTVDPDIARIQRNILGR